MDDMDDRVWILECRGKSRGGICVSSDDDQRSFPFFNLEGNFFLERMDNLHVIVHHDNVPFGHNSGFSCRPFDSSLISYPHIDSTDTVADSEASVIAARDDVWKHRVLILNVKHVFYVVVKESDDDKDDNEDGSESQSKSQSESESESEHESESESESESDADADADADADDGYIGFADEDNPTIYKIGVDQVPIPDFLHPDIPVIIAHDLGYWDDSVGCPVFSDTGLVGTYLFCLDKKYEYILPRSFLHKFVLASLDSINQGGEGLNKVKSLEKGVTTKGDAGSSSSLPPRDVTATMTSGYTKNAGAVPGHKNVDNKSLIDGKLDFPNESAEKLKLWKLSKISGQSQSHLLSLPDMGIRTRTPTQLNKWAVAGPLILAFHHQDNDIIAIGKEDSSIQIYDPPVDEVRATLEVHQKRITGLAFSNAQNVLVSSGSDSQLCVWSMDAWEMLACKPMQNLSGRAMNPLSDILVQFHRDQTRLLAVNETQVAIYKAPELECLKQWVAPEARGPITCATHSFDSQSIYASFQDGSISIITASNLRQRCRINPIAYLPPNPSTRVFLLAAHPSDADQFALGLTNDGVYVLKPLVSEGQWGTPLAEVGAGTSKDSGVAGKVDHPQR